MEDLFEKTVAKLASKVLVTNFLRVLKDPERDLMKTLVGYEGKGIPLGNDGYGPAALHQAAAQDRLDVIDFLMTRKVFIDSEDRFGDTALVYASGAGATDAVEYLLTLGAQANHISAITGGTALHKAANVEIAEMLLLHGGAMDHQNNAGHTPLHMSVLDNRFDVMKLLLDRGARLDPVSLDQRTARMIALEEGQPEFLVYLDRVQLSRLAGVADKQDDICGAGLTL